MEPENCAQVLETLITLGQQDRLPCVLLRPRPAQEDLFQGDFDFLIDGARFDEILAAVFDACRHAGVSFLVRQRSPFKRQIELLGGAGRITLELWSQAEFRTGQGHGLLTRAALDYLALRRAGPQAQAGLLAAIFVLHLHHKRKDLESELTRWRLEHFAGQPGLPDGLRRALQGLRSGDTTLDDAHAQALACLRDWRVPVVRPWRVAARRMAAASRAALRWRARRTTAVVGPDGSGKTALIDAVSRAPGAPRLRVQRFKRFFRRPLFHVFRNEPRNVRDEKMLWLVLPVAWLYFQLSHWLAGWGRDFVLDRYFYDYLVTDVRSDTRPLRRIAGYAAWSALVPRPDRLVVATCPSDIIFQRKREMSAAAIDALYRVYLDQIVRSGVPETLCCHTGGPLEAAQARMADLLASLHR